MTVIKKLLCGFATLTILFALSSCSGCSGNRGEGEGKEFPGEAPVNPEVEAVDNIADNSILVTIDEIKHNDIIVTEVNKPNRYSLNYGRADLEDKIIGTLKVGAQFSILPDKTKENVIIAINVDELSGQWFYDMKDSKGFTFEKYGGLSSINTDEISYREWTLKNGKLYIFYVTEDMVAPKRDEYLVEEASIEDLTSDRLVLYFRSDTYTCQRQKEAVQIQMNL